MTDRVIATAADVDSIRDDIEAVLDGWYPGGSRIDWHDFLDRLEARGYELPQEMLSPPVKRIKAVVRELRSAP